MPELAARIYTEESLVKQADNFKVLIRGDARLLLSKLGISCW